MRKGLTLIIWVILFANSTYADKSPPLRIAVSHFSPPFVIQNSNRDLSGFDIDLMLHICQNLHRQCEFVPMRSTQILAAVSTGKVDVGLGGIDISVRKYRNINYSVPYMLSEYRFIANKNSELNKSNEIDIKNKIIGVAKGGLASKYFDQFAKQNNIKVREYKDFNRMISSLLSGKIHMAMVHNATAIYWQNNSSGQINIVGSPVNMGFGIGIPVFDGNGMLIKDINRAITSYKSSPQYKQLYSIYFGNFS